MSTCCMRIMASQKTIGSVNCSGWSLPVRTNDSVVAVGNWSSAYCIFQNGTILSTVQWYKCMMLLIHDHLVIVSNVFACEIFSSFATQIIGQLNNLRGWYLIQCDIE